MFPRIALAFAMFSFSACCQMQSAKTPVRVTCSCDDPVTNQLVDSFTSRLYGTEQYEEAPSHSSFEWRISIETSPVPEFSSAIALSVVVIHNGVLLDHWADFCRASDISSCAKKTLHGVVRTITVQNASSQPALQPPPPSKHRTGDDLAPRIGPSGHGKLSLDCPDNLYSVVHIIGKNQSSRYVFVRPHDPLVFEDMAPGSYWIKVAQSSSFDDAQNRLVGNVEYFEFPQAVEFTERDDGNVLHYKEWSLTLAEIPGGNVHVTPITAADFRSNSTP